MSKQLVVLKSRKPIVGTSGSFIAVYGLFFIHEGYVEVANGDGLTLRFPHDAVDFTVDGIEGSYIEPLVSDQDTLVL